MVAVAVLDAIKASGYVGIASANFTRPADVNPYAVADLIANSTTAGSVVAMSFAVARFAAGSGMIRRARLRKSGAVLTNASFRLHLYKAAPTPSNGDNGVWLTNGVANYVGSFDIFVDRAFTDGAQGIGIANIGSELNFLLASGTAIFGLLEARAAYTPISAEVFTIDLEVLQN